MSSLLLWDLACPRDFQRKLERMGLHVAEENVFSSAREHLGGFSYQPNRVVESLADVEPE